MNLQQFEDVLNETLKTLPRKEQLSHLTAEEAHHMPDILVQAGEKLGVIAEALAKNPDLAPEGAEFYQGCAQGPDLSDAVRALCLGNLMKLAQQDASIDVNPIDYPDNVRRLADALPVEAVSSR